ncbi:class I SAM-dependent methyltransferase [Streptomyces qaidamensis]|uniref:class I SAM-dependent methyltransferase n=1 Tax=Streptomyces qaidamensis TaxID=1783515 RepID=UPI00365E7D30
MNHVHTHTPHHGASHGHHHEHAMDGQAEILDLDAEVLAEYTASITAWLPLQTAPHHIVDLGCGTGAGTFALLDRFPDAHVTAVDASAEHLQRLRTKACTRSVEERVRTVQTDLDDEAWPDLGSPDLVWASASMHHMAHPDRALRNVHDALAPGGLFAVVELAGHPRFLPENAPEDRPGLEERVHAAAGFTVEGERTIAVDFEGSRSEAIGRYATGVLQRIRSVIAGRLSPEDLTALDQLLDTSSPHSILRRDDLTVRTERTVWAARRT